MSLPRALVAALVLLLYFRSPIDLLPDRLGPLGLVDDVLVALLAVRWLQGRWPFAGRRQPQAAAAAGPAAEAPWDPYAVLGVRPGATPEEITQAYREQMKRYHPDRVADLGPELQRLAHERALAIQRAYTELVDSGVREP